ncbi:hypothetical protein LTR97_000288 [Elasticomyces elasticus]|uniref:Uncharacterized protein n=1 Tax=Elasticomyces elasticus TaxID=574655 RepID=A0AAN8A5F0_9PEZI|nr:hypothetical protein LTR97_000288 [Elasticomyces elasticus]
MGKTKAPQELPENQSSEPTVGTSSSPIKLVWCTERDPRATALQQHLKKSHGKASWLHGFIQVVAGDPPDPREYSQVGFRNAVRWDFMCDRHTLQLASLAIHIDSQSTSYVGFDLMTCDWQAMLEELKRPFWDDRACRMAVIIAHFRPSRSWESIMESENRPAVAKSDSLLTDDDDASESDDGDNLLGRTSQDPLTITLAESKHFEEGHGVGAMLGSEGHSSIIPTTDSDAAINQVSDGLTGDADVAKGATAFPTVGEDEEENLELQLKEVQIKRQLLRLRKRKRDESGVEE